MTIKIMNTELKQGQWRRYVAWLMACIFGIYQFSLQSVGGLMTHELMRGFDLNAVSVSYVLSSFFYVFLIMQIPAGLILDRYAKCYILPTAAALCAIGCFIFASADHLSWLIIGRMCTGIGGAFGFIGILSAARSYFPLRFFAVIVGISECIGFLGTALGEHSFAMLLQGIGWRGAMNAVGVIGVVVSLGLLIALHPKVAPKHDYSPPVKGESVWSHLRVIVHEPCQWLVGVISFCLFSLISVFAALWGAPALARIYNLNLSDAALSVSAIFIGIAIGASLMGSVAHSARLQPMAMMIGSFIAAIFMAVIIFYPRYLNFSGLLVLLVLTGIASSGYVICFAFSGQIAAPGAGSASVGFVNMITMSAALIMQPVMGSLIGLHGPLNVIDGSPIYAIADYQRGGGVIVVLFVLAFFASAFLQIVSSRQSLGHLLVRLDARDKR
ncbi:MFS transporter [Piscirickettsia salmonis]|uniref:D-galactarate permease n=2 Tax=Piscirickettsia salmonis TaxID=1238 RepID=A0A9Q6LTL5_PISSA|nr:MFS transporter [Piscirickettsia salmonis]ALA24842.1 major Facilitator Superfamily protein [Piscirickettsia salmonis]ERL60935.1 major Facilitator Superfamily protein [Piscirickettsia salmonis LF-89 = ATCC VR-1361]QGN77498.1 D-galactarate permease [Piscirickettsia salmonis]QGN81085.1 D-galactarate permease [Piscirickettsia salmonis]QGN84642.1 D-galactarate permease [Piscirickettsia salmonis]